jgi:hypothetical protein
MPSDPAWYSRIWEYFSSVIGYWQFWVAVAFMMERAFERFCPTLAAKLNPYLTPDRRRRLFVWIGVLAFVYANFRAFDDENRRLREAQAFITESKAISFRNYDKFSDHDMERLKAAFDVQPRPKISIYYVSFDMSAGIIAEQLSAALNAPATIGTLSNEDLIGITVFIKNRDNLERQAKVYIGAFREVADRSEIDFRLGELPDTVNNLFDCVIFIGPRKVVAR